MQLYELGAAEAVALMRRGELSPVELTQTLLDRIAETDPRVQAWETLDADGALAAARSLEDRRQERLPRSTLFGLPVGIKDVFDVRALPTTANFYPYRDRVAPEDSGVVRHLREAGAIILGKTVTVQFACGRDSPKTRNPWDLERTPAARRAVPGQRSPRDRCRPRSALRPEARPCARRPIAASRRSSRRSVASAGPACCR